MGMKLMAGWLGRDSRGAFTLDLVFESSFETERLAGQPSETPIQIASKYEQ